jgi:hypothetical protein
VILKQFEVQSGWHKRQCCPLQCEIDSPEGMAPEALRLRDGRTGEEVPLQAWFTGKGRLALSWIVDEMDFPSQRTYVLVADEGIREPATEAVRLLQDRDGELKVTLGGEFFTGYHFGAEVVRPYLYPILSPGGVGVTRNWPMVADVSGETHDHPHHKGLYTAHGDVNGVDDWSEMPGHGYMIHRRFTRLFDGAVAGGFTQELDWTDAEHNRVLAETRRARFYSTPPELRLFDWEVTLHASDGEIVMGDTKEGGLISVRVATSMDASDKGWIENGCGSRHETETWGKRAPWCDYSGPVERAWRGICLMDHVDNPRHPTHWHVRNYGLMTANCFGLHDFNADTSSRWDLVIPAGESRTWRYRVLVHEGDAEEGKASIHYHDFAHPPQVRELPL